MVLLAARGCGVDSTRNKIEETDFCVGHGLHCEENLTRLWSWSILVAWSYPVLNVDVCTDWTGRYVCKRSFRVMRLFAPIHKGT